MKNNKPKIENELMSPLLLEKFAFFINYKVSTNNYYAKKQDTDVRKVYLDCCDEIQKKRSDLFKEIKQFKDVSENEARLNKHISGWSEEFSSQFGFKNEVYPRYKDNISRLFVVTFANKLKAGDLIENLLSLRYSKDNKGRMNTVNRMYASLDGFSDELIKHFSNVVFKTKAETQNFNCDENSKQKSDLMFIQKKLEVPQLLYSKASSEIKKYSKKKLIDNFDNIKSFYIYSNTIVDHYTTFYIKDKVSDLFLIHQKAEKMDDYEDNIKKLLNVYPQDGLKNAIIRDSKEIFLKHNQIDEKIHENLFKYITPDNEYSEISKNNFLKKNTSLKYMLSHLDFLINRKSPVTDSSVGYKFFNGMEDGLKSNIESLTNEPVEFLLTDDKMLFNLIVPQGAATEKVEKIFFLINETISSILDEYIDKVENRRVITRSDFFDEYFENLINVLNLNESLDKKDMIQSQENKVIKKVNKV